MDATPIAAPLAGDDWVALSALPLPQADATAWVVRPTCGASVTFAGLARDHSEGRHGVVELEYEAYEGAATKRMGEVAAEVRRRWPDVGRLALLHRTGRLAVGDVAVVVAVSTPHRDSAFEAARFAIDELKRTVPLWKRETWADGDDWGLAAQSLLPVGSGEPPP